MKKIIVLIVLCFSARLAMGQQDAMLSQYMFNGLFINPAYAGSHKYFSSSLLYRTQWVNFEGAPKTALFAIDGPVKSEKMGVGLIVSNDQIGVTKQNDVYLNYSYNITLGSGKLAFGLKGGMSQYSAALTTLTYWDKSDQIYANNVTNVVMPKFGAGVYYYTEKWYAGLSLPTMLAYDGKKKFNLDVNKSSELRRHFYLTGGYVYTINESWKLKPSFLVKYVPAAPPELDINFSAMFKDMIWLGVSYRSKDAIVAIIEYQANMRFRVGYAYDITTTNLNKYSNGSHEIMIGYDLGKEIAKVKTPRYF